MPREDGDAGSHDAEVDEAAQEQAAGDGAEAIEVTELSAASWEGRGRAALGWT